MISISLAYAIAAIAPNMDAASALLPTYVTSETSGTRTHIWMRHLLHSPPGPKYGCGICFTPHLNPNMDAAPASLPTRTQIWMRHLLRSPPGPKYGCGICCTPHPNPNMDAASAALPTRTQIWMRHLLHSPPGPKYGSGVCITAPLPSANSTRRARTRAHEIEHTRPTRPDRCSVSLAI